MAIQFSDELSSTNWLHFGSYPRQTSEIRVSKKAQSKYNKEEEEKQRLLI